MLSLSSVIVVVAQFEFEDPAIEIETFMSLYSLRLLLLFLAFVVLLRNQISILPIVRLAVLKDTNVRRKLDVVKVVVRCPSDALTLPSFSNIRK